MSIKTVNIPRESVEIIRIMRDIPQQQFTPAQREYIARIFYAAAHPHVMRAIHQHVVDLSQFDRGCFGALSIGEYAMHKGLPVHLARACLEHAEADGLLDSRMEKLPRGRPRKVYVRPGAPESPTS
jgi:hypothetical protein